MLAAVKSGRLPVEADTSERTCPKAITAAAPSAS
jgi:hypothetical protein